LFLVPGCTGAVLIKALLNGDLKKVFAYEESKGVLHAMHEKKD